MRLLGQIKTGIATLALVMGLAGTAVAAEAGDFLWPGRGGNDGDYENGINAARAGDWHMSVHYLRRSVGRDPQDADALTILALSHRKLGHLDRAMRFYRAALVIDPGHRLAHFQIGEAYLAARDLSKARKHEESLADLCPSGCPELKALKRAIAVFEGKGPDS